MERFVEYVYSTFDSGIWQLRAGGCSAIGNLVVLMHERANALGLDAGAQRRALLRLSESAEFDDSPDVRMAALKAIKDVIRMERMVVELCATSVVGCAGASNTGMRNGAERVLRRAVLLRGGAVDEKGMALLQSCVDEEDWRLVERRMARLASLGESDEKHD